MRSLLVVIALSFLLPIKSFSLQQQISGYGEKVVIVDPSEHAWGAYDANGNLIRSGLASAGADFCPDMGQPCHTDVGSFRIISMGGSGCTSPSFPIPRGGAPMPYCMYFNHAQALHGYPHVDAVNRSHGCVRLHTSDARWLRNNFVQQGTLVVIEPY